MPKEEREKLKWVTIVWIAILVSPLLYVASIAPASRVLYGPQAYAHVTCPSERFQTTYRPVWWLMNRKVVGTPLVWWCKLWSVNFIFDLPEIGGPITMTAEVAGSFVDEKSPKSD